VPASERVRGRCRRPRGGGFRRRRPTRNGDHWGLGFAGRLGGARQRPSNRGGSRSPAPVGAPGLPVWFGRLAEPDGGPSRTEPHPATARPTEERKRRLLRNLPPPNEKRRKNELRPLFLFFLFALPFLRSMCVPLVYVMVWALGSCEFSRRISNRSAKSIIRSISPESSKGLIPRKLLPSSSSEKQRIA
jgi:hypothetical protein